MKIQNFSAKAVHGYLDFNVNFNSNLSFLTGGNGSGKTTVVRSIVALISPNFLYLAKTDFAEMLVSVEHETKRIEIRAFKTEDGIGISTSDEMKPLEIPLFDVSTVENYPPSRQLEAEVEFYRDQEANYVGHPVFKSIQDLPTPMFLGLERRAEADEYRTSASWTARTYRNRNVFRGTLQQSLNEAARVAANKFRKIKGQEYEITDKLRQDIILTNFEFIDALPGRFPEKFPSKSERERIQDKRTDVKKTLFSLGIERKYIDDYVDSYFDNLENIINQLPKTGRVDAAFKDPKISENAKSAMFNWITNKWQFDKLTKIVDYIDQYNDQIAEINAPITKYLNVINKFLGDTGKMISFDRTGYPQAQIKDLEPRDIHSLSSGEQQLVVILTHIAFNPAAQAANVLIIDEPELSLHVVWQEFFVDAIREVNPNLQLILATHSPSIVLDNTENCIDLIESAA
jgi:predicted ATP-binding protein involved in virulence